MKVFHPQFQQEEKNNAFSSQIRKLIYLKHFQIEISKLEMILFLEFSYHKIHIYLLSNEIQKSL